MKTPRELIELAATIANDLDIMAALPADRITHIAFGNDADDNGPQRHLYTLAEVFEHPTPELQAAFATTAAWLRDVLPALGDPAEAGVNDDDDTYAAFYPEQVAEVLGTKLLVDADVVAYWRPAELGSALAGRDTATMFTLAATFTGAWENYLEGDQPHLKMMLGLAAERANRLDADMIDSQLRVLARRDEVVRSAVAAGRSKNHIHTVTGIARTTIDRILD